MSWVGGCQSGFRVDLSGLEERAGDLCEGRIEIKVYLSSTRYWKGIVGMLI